MLSEAALALEETAHDDSGNVMDSVKLIASDMDGTLLNGKGELDPAFFSLYKEMTAPVLVAMAVYIGKTRLIDNFIYEG